MNLKRTALFALLLVVVATSAQALDEPKCNLYYRCHYTNYTGPIVQDGLSMFIGCPSGLFTNPTYLTEKFQSKFNGQVIWDNRRVAFAKPGAILEANPTPPPPRIRVATQWEFTASPTQCKNTVVWREDGNIDYGDCTDGSSRSCIPVP